MISENKKEILGTVEFSPFGVSLVITKENGAYDHASMRAAHLSALTTVLSGEGGEHFDLCAEKIKSDVMWLVSSLAQELQDLLPIVSAEARANGAGQVGRQAAKINKIREDAHDTVS
jgi:hypothetical protein